MRLFKTLYHKTFLKNPLAIPGVPSANQEYNETRLYRTQTGTVPVSVYQKWLQEAQQKQLAIPLPDLDIPYNFEGIDTVPETKQSFIVHNLLGDRKISMNKITAHLVQVYKAFLQAMVNEDSEFLNEYCEKQFAEATLKSLAQLRNNGDKLIAFEDFSINNGDPFPYKGFAVDDLLIRGLSVDRSQNKAEEYYHYYNDIETLGMVIFSPSQLSDPLAFQDQKFAEKMFNDYQKMILRVLIRVQSPMRLKVLKANGQELLADTDNYSFNHMVLYETQMEAPPKHKSFQKMENYQQWICKYSPTIWKIVDVDNWFKCNPIIPGADVKYTDEIFKGSKFDPDVLDIRRI